MSIAYGGDQITFPDASTQNTGATGFGFKNRIIDGAMVIDQRNNGASVTPTDNAYTVDRWQYSVSQASKLTAQQSTTAATGFINSLLTTSSSAYSIAAGDYFMINQRIEGLNTFDLGWGTASAKTVTVSFWVRSSLTGTFGGVINNAANDRSYPFTYTISVANTYEYKTVTIAGDTSGSWLTTNGIGLIVRFGLGIGSTYSGTAGAWSGSTYFGATGATSVVGTSGATFYITGVQLEKGSTATSFDYRPYGTELALCQRYYQRNTVGSSSVSTFLVGVATGSTTSQRCTSTLSTSMRSTPTIVVSSLRLYDGAAAPAVTSIAGQASSTTIASVDLTASAGGLTSGKAVVVIENGTSSYLELTAEL